MNGAHVLDASALLALLHSERGADHVRAVLPESLISSVNWSEVLQKSLARGARIQLLCRGLPALGLRVVSFEAADAEVAANLWTDTKNLRLSLADRACLATARRLKLPVLTGDRSWKRLNVGVPVVVIR